MTLEPASYPRHRFPAEIISHAVWLYYVFSLSLRDVELILAERGILVTHESIRRHCQVNRYGDACGRSKRDKEASCCLVDAGLLSPYPERLRASAAIAACGHQVAPRPKVTAAAEEVTEFIVLSAKPICRIMLLEATHTSDSSLDPAMVLFKSIVQVNICPVADFAAQR
jgi:hypothetical protein